MTHEGDKSEGWLKLLRWLAVFAFFAFIYGLRNLVGIADFGSWGFKKFYPMLYHGWPAAFLIRKGGNHVGSTGSPVTESRLPFDVSDSYFFPVEMVFDLIVVLFFIVLCSIACRHAMRRLSRTYTLRSLFIVTTGAAISLAIMRGADSHWLNVLDGLLWFFPASAVIYLGIYFVRDKKKNDAPRELIQDI